MSQYVLIFSLGPVQSFIAEARRTKDLWAGSQMLVELARVAVQAAGGELVYPAPEVLTEADVPNKFVTNVDNPTEAVKNAIEAAKNRWRGFANDALGKLPENKDNELQAIWEQQRDHHLEFYWAAAPLNGNYIHAYQTAAKTLDARKHTRNFEQIKEEGLKDSLSGSRSALRTAQDKGKREETRARLYWKRMWESRQTRANFKKGEYLDTIGAMKRFALDRQFPSVSTVTSTPFARRCREAGLLDDLRQAIETFNRKEGDEFFYKVDQDDKWKRGFEYDGDLLYGETYASIRLDASYGKTTHPPTEIVAKLNKMYKEMNSKPTPYYAILAMDGDRMGKHIGACDTKDEHTEISRRLAIFAEKAEDVIKSKGYKVYTGGDDVLAFFPLKSVLPGTAELAQAYSQQFAEWNQHESDGTLFPFTVSAGIAVAHHLHPLDAVLEEARRAEKAAKNRYQRNALCISVLKRSGEAVCVGSKWGGDEFGVIDLVSKVISDLKEERLASRFVYELYDQVATLGVVDEDILASSLKRLLKRHQRKVDEQPETKLDDLMAWANAFTRESLQVEGGAAAELSRWLLLAQFIAQEGGSE